PETPPDPPGGLLRRACDGVQAGLGAAAHACGCVLGLAGSACGSVLGQAAGVKRVVGAGWRLAKRFKARLLAACRVGLAAGAPARWAGQWLGAGVAWAGGFVAPLALQAVAGLRRLVAPATALTSL